AIRHAVGQRASALVLEGDTVALAIEAATVDVAEFERTAARGDLAGLSSAADLYRGDLLAGLPNLESAFEEWLLPERERLRELAIEVLAKLLGHHRRAGDIESALHTALRLLTLDPLLEAAHRTVMRLYAEHGRRADALKQYQLCKDALARHLG